VPNKAIRHTELDAAIEVCLLTGKVKAKLEWKEVEDVLLKKISTERKSGPRFSYSLNSIAGAISVNTSEFMKSAAFFTKRWASAIYLITGSIVLLTGTYFVYDLTKTIKTAKSSTITNTSIPVKEAPVKEEARVKMEKTASGENTAASEKPAIISPQNSVLEQSPSGAETVVQEGENLSTENHRHTFENTTESTEQEDIKKSKVLYYKESLSLDKLEQQLSSEKKDSLK
jgi:hypothetical protein